MIVLPKIKFDMRSPMMSSHALSQLKNKNVNPYVLHFDLAWQNLLLWKEDQRKKRIEHHRNKLLR